MQAHIALCIGKGIRGKPWVVPALCDKEAIFPDGPFSTMAKVTAVTTVLPHSNAQILTQSKNSENELKQTMLHSENARSAVFALWT